MSENVFNLGDAAVELGLLVFCLVVFAVFRKVAEGAGLLQMLRDLKLAGGLQIVQLLFELRQPDAGQLEFLCHRTTAFHDK